MRAPSVRTGGHVVPIPAPTVPRLRLGVDRPPRQCGHCGGRLLDRYACPTGRTHLLTIYCVLCGTDLCEFRP